MNMTSTIGLLVMSPLGSIAGVLTIGAYLGIFWIMIVGLGAGCVIDYAYQKLTHEK